MTAPASGLIEHERLGIPFAIELPARSNKGTGGAEQQRSPREVGPDLFSVQTRRGCFASTEQIAASRLFGQRAELNC